MVLIINFVGGIKYFRGVQIFQEKVDRGAQIYVSYSIIYMIYSCIVYSSCMYPQVSSQKYFLVKFNPLVVRCKEYKSTIVSIK